MNVIIKCRKCRTDLISHPENTILNIHGGTLNVYDKECIRNSVCNRDVKNDVFYIQETEMPEWIINTINEADWIKGKLKCPECSARLGSFDFVSGLKCPCYTAVVPPVHIVKSKVDLVRPLG